MSLLESYGKRKRSIDSGVPFRKGTGLFLASRSASGWTSRCRTLAPHERLYKARSVSPAAVEIAWCVTELAA